jgi:kumamolisin
MGSRADTFALAGSVREPLSGATAVDAVAPDEVIEVEVILRPRAGGKPFGSPTNLGAVPPKERHYVSREELLSARSADPEDVAQVEVFARGHGLEVINVDATRRAVVLAGPAQAMSATFGVELRNYESPAGCYRGYEGPLRLPGQFKGIVQAVLGLDDRPQATRKTTSAAGEDGD